MSAKIKDTPDYATPGVVLDAIELMQFPERVRARNRSKIDALFNGALPYTAEQVKEHQIQINVNWGEGAKILQDANRQLNNALLHKGNFVTCTALKGRVEKRDEWSSSFTTNINRKLKRDDSGLKYLFLLKSRNASLAMHGIGVLMWANSYDWMPRFVPLEDILIPTGTLQGFINLTHFAVNMYLTPYELMTMTHENSKQAEESGWNLKAVRKILAAYGDLNANPNQYNWWDQPEDMVSVWKQNRGACNADAVPKVNLCAFYYRSTEGGAQGKEKWYRKIVLKDTVSPVNGDSVDIKDQFIFDSGTRVFADQLKHILSVQYGDCNLMAPLQYHSTRGLGEMLFAPSECINRLRCQFMQHTFEQLMMGLRVSNPEGQDRPKVFNLKPYFVLEQGVEIIPKEQRHQIDPRLVEAAMSENRQILSENSASFVQDVDNGTGKEQTLGEAQIRLQSANKMVSAMLDMMYLLEQYKDEEIVRRFLLPNSADPDVIEFQAQCRKDGIPDDLMKPECWQVDVDRVAGGGDQTLAMQENQLLLNNSQRFDPTSQRMILRNWTMTMTRDPAKAKLLVPDEPPKVTAGQEAAEDVFGTLMSGAPVGLREGIEQQDYVVAMMTMMNAVIQRIEQTDQMGTPQDVIGLNMVANDIQQHLDLMAQNPENKEFVTAVAKDLGKQMNLVKAYQQRQQEQAQQGQPDPEAIAKAQATEAAASQKLEINQANFQQKQQQSEEKFAQKLRQAEEQQAAKIKTMLDEARLEIESLRAKTMAEISAYQAKTSAEIQQMQEKAAAAPVEQSSSKKD